MEQTKIEYKGKKYGIWFSNGVVCRIRSESNLDKQPSLTYGSKLFNEICKFIES